MSNIGIYQTTAYNCWSVVAASYHTICSPAIHCSALHYPNLHVL